MKKLMLVAMTLTLAGAVWAAEGMKKEKAAASASVTLTGEVLDLSCYLGHGAAGGGHMKCAKACLTDKGAPAGLLTKDGKIFLLVQSHEGEKAYKALCALGGEQAKVTGTKNDKGGLQAIVVDKVEKVEKP